MTIRLIATLATAAAMSLGAVAALPTMVQAAGPLPCNSGCYAPSITGGGGSSSQTAAFVGLQWNFGSQSPEVTGGVRYLTSNEDGLVYGAQADAALPLMGDAFAPTIRLLGLAGNADIQVQAGVGYDFGSALPLLAVGAQTAYLSGGANIELGGAVNPYLGVSTLARPSLGSAGVLGCPTGGQLTPVVDGTVDGGSIGVDGGVVVDGQTCYSPG